VAASEIDKNHSIRGKFSFLSLNYTQAQAYCQGDTSSLPSIILSTWRYGGGQEKMEAAWSS